MRILFSGGGTGGHIYPAIAVAENIKERFPDAQMLFVGAEGRMEMSKVPEAGFEIEGLWISGLQRKLTFGNLLFPFKLLSSLLRARAIIKRFRPEIVAGFGGYASGATLYMAQLMGIPTLIQEQNSYPGITNKLLANKVDRICVAYDKVINYFDRDKVIVTGNPLRKLASSGLSKNEARKRLNMNEHLSTVLIVGGSLGAKSFNVVMEASYLEWSEWKDVQVIWQTGVSYFSRFENTNTAKLPNIYCQAFISDMATAYAAADLIVCRAGALTISELTVLGKACLLIPSPNVAEDHQTKNAMALVEKNAAVMIKDIDIHKLFMPSIKDILADLVMLRSLETEAVKLGYPNATKEIADELLKLINN
jgi:UDP-N-acetylglucosamine--N-acetylmuramyl-(pentapeptide) pyrophosphoryl-undecaprenol N-acetylglucosamine transferase